MRKRIFRTQESFISEQERRNAVAPLLEHYGFTVTNDYRQKRGTAITQIISANHKEIGYVKMRVRLCWRRSKKDANADLYSAAQLRAKLKNNDWDETLKYISARDAQENISHNLFIQNEEHACRLAVLVPSDQLPAIWAQQRAVSADLIRLNTAFHNLANHAENGSSPTIWLQDDRRYGAHSVADVLWSWPGVINLLAFTPAERTDQYKDIFDDFPDSRDLGRDSSERSQNVIKSRYPRDQKVRQAVLERAGGKCERAGCSALRAYTGFLDVHHILGVGISDRVWSCVALCPNCHRDAHFAEDRDAINTALQDFARQFG